MSQKQFNDVMYAASVIIAVLAFASLTVFKNRLWGELSFAFLMFITFARHADHKAEIEKIKKQNRKVICALEERRSLLAIQLERFSEDETEFKRFLESEIASLRKIISKYEDD